MTQGRDGQTRLTSVSDYDIPTKQLALEILEEYARATGHKWTHIRKAIFRAVGADFIKDAKLLTRQDLERWASGDSVIGNSKFAWVYQYLTAPETLQNPLFKKAHALLKPDTDEDKLGHALAAFYSNFDRSRFLRASVTDRRPASKVIEVSLCGVWKDQDPREDAFLRFFHDKTARFLKVERFVFPRAPHHQMPHRIVERETGVMTIGSRCIIHLTSKHRTSRMLFAYPDHRDSITVVSDVLIEHAQMMSRAALEDRHNNPAKYHGNYWEEGYIAEPSINPEKATRRFLRSNFSILEDFLDQSKSPT